MADEKKVKRPPLHYPDTPTNISQIKQDYIRDYVVGKNIGKNEFAEIYAAKQKALTENPKDKIGAFRAMRDAFAAKFFPELIKPEVSFDEWAAEFIK